MQYRDFKIGPGEEITEEHHVTVQYTSHSLYGRLLEDSQRTFPSGVNFVVSSKSVPVVLSNGVMGMKVGGRREIIAPCHCHFPEIYPGQILIYQIDVLSGKKLTQAEFKRLTKVD